MPCSVIPEYDFALYKGDDKIKMFRYKANDLPVNIEDYVIQLETPILSLNKTATISDAEDGRFNFIFEKADTVDLTNNRVKYEVVFYPTGLAGTKKTMFRGSINLTGEVA